ncbi:hypothetical protein [Clostridiisalibacter paucivorans]|uniref:hypothetical protein n=1 Tax=Clostridiisalibacter paucivorans TaxID=408753 RepID=UPI0004793DF4|nr:hypothetical protein [Clostridiisalibacter paucivorans]
MAEKFTNIKVRSLRYQESDKELPGFKSINSEQGRLSYKKINLVKRLLKMGLPMKEVSEIIGVDIKMIRENNIKLMH